MLLRCALFALNDAVQLVRKTLLLLFEPGRNEHVREHTTKGDANKEGGKYDQCKVRHFKTPRYAACPRRPRDVIIDNLSGKPYEK
jgi:hypothetical protein